MLLKDFVTRMRTELGKFGVIGLVAYIIDLTIFNVLRFSGGEGPLYD
jgi:putative flippase GtrA